VEREPRHDDDGYEEKLALLDDRVPLVATGGIAPGGGVAAVLAAGASAAHLSTAFMLTPEAGTSAAHREALAGDRPTALTRAFTGRTAREIENRARDSASCISPVRTSIRVRSPSPSPGRRAAGDEERGLPTAIPVQASTPPRLVSRARAGNPSG